MHNWLDSAHDRALRRLLTREAELKDIERWIKEAKSWYEETICEEEKDNRKGATKYMKERRKKRTERENVSRNTEQDEGHKGRNERGRNNTRIWKCYK